MSEKRTLSVIKADVGGFVGHSRVHPEMLEVAFEELDGAVDSGVVLDYDVIPFGDDVALILLHERGVDNEKIHGLAWDVFSKMTDVAASLRLYGAGQDLLADAFSGNVKGLGPGVAEMEIELRKSEPVLIFGADKTSPSAWNLVLFKIFADPFNTAGLVLDPKMHDGFVFEVLDVYEGKRVRLSTPEETYDLLAIIGNTSRFVVKAVYKKSGEIAAVSSTQKLNLIAGEYVGKDDPVLIVRAKSGFPAVGEILEPFAFPHLVPGWMRGSHNGPIMPVSVEQATPSRFDGPPRVVGVGYQLTPDFLGEYADLFDDPSFDRARERANMIADYMRGHGPFEPHRLPAEDMEYTTLPKVLEKLKDRFEED